jgi:hypothetical protein
MDRLVLSDAQCARISGPIIYRPATAGRPSRLAELPAAPNTAASCAAPPLRPRFLTDDLMAFERAGPIP